jgi:tRNA G46 methylase TrmB
MENEPEHTSYDEVPYESQPFVQTHPDRLSTLGRLFGLVSVPITQSRVLELGCAGGGNLIPMACQLPQSQFVGVDLSIRQVEKGRQVIQDLRFSAYP